MRPHFLYDWGFKPCPHRLKAFLRNRHNGSWIDINGTAIRIDDFPTTSRSSHH
jgi:hypothetical protein